MNIPFPITEEFLDAIADRVAKKIARPVSSRAVSIAEAAKVIGASRETIRLAVHAGNIKRVPGISAIRIPASEIERLLNPKL